MGEDEGDAGQRDPYHAYALARQAGGLTFMPEQNSWLVSRHDDVLEVLRRPEDFSSANTLPLDDAAPPAAQPELAKSIGGRRVVVNSDGAAHRHYRNPVATGLSHARVTALVPFIEERAEALVDAFAPPSSAHGQVEFISQYARVLPGEVIGHAIGLDPADVPVAVRNSYRAVELLLQPLDEVEQVDAARDYVALRSLLDNYARRRREEPRQDLCTKMVSSLAPGTGELTLDQRHEVVSNLQNVLIAGHITTTPLIATTVSLLLQHRSQWELICAQPGLIPAAVEEAARYDAAVQGVNRITTRSVTLAGVDLPAGAAVFVALGSANRDETAHDRPDVFDITRSLTRHLSFGHGLHACPGAGLARQEVQITLRTLTQRLPGLRFVADEPVTVEPTLVRPSPHALHLTW